RHDLQPVDAVAADADRAVVRDLDRAAAAQSRLQRDVAVLALHVLPLARDQRSLAVEGEGAAPGEAVAVRAGHDEEPGPRERDVQRVARALDLALGEVRLEMAVVDRGPDRRRLRRTRRLRRVLHHELRLEPGRARVREVVRDRIEAPERGERAGRRGIDALLHCAFLSDPPTDGGGASVVPDAAGMPAGALRRRTGSRVPPVGKNFRLPAQPAALTPAPAAAVRTPRRNSASPAPPARAAATQPASRRASASGSPSRRAISSSGTPASHRARTRAARSSGSPSVRAATAVVPAAASATKRPEPSARPASATCRRGRPPAAAYATRPCGAGRRTAASISAERTRSSSDAARAASRSSSSRARVS